MPGAGAGADDGLPSDRADGADRADGFGGLPFTAGDTADGSAVGAAEGVPLAAAVEGVADAEEDGDGPGAAAIWAGRPAGGAWAARAAGAVPGRVDRSGWPGFGGWAVVGCWVLAGPAPAVGCPGPDMGLAAAAGRGEAPRDRPGSDRSVGSDGSVRFGAPPRATAGGPPRAAAGDPPCAVIGAAGKSPAARVFPTDCCKPRDIDARGPASGASALAALIRSAARIGAAPDATPSARSGGADAGLVCGGSDEGGFRACAWACVLVFVIVKSSQVMAC